VYEPQHNLGVQIPLRFASGIIRLML